MRHRIVSRTTVVAAVCGLTGLAGLAACDSGGDPTTSTTSTSTPPSITSTTTSSSSTSSSSTSAAYVPVKPQFPAAAKKQTLKSAEAFVEYFYELANYSFAKPEKGLVGALSTSDCQPCQRMETEAQELVSSNRKYSDEILSIDRVTASTEDLTNPALVLQGTQHEVPILEPDGSLTDASPEMKANFRVYLRWTSNGWRVKDVANA